MSSVRTPAASAIGKRARGEEQVGGIREKKRHCEREEYLGGSLVEERDRMSTVLERIAGALRIPIHNEAENRLPRVPLPQFIPVRTLTPCLL